jgi:hypothetical protein
MTLKAQLRRQSKLLRDCRKALRKIVNLNIAHTDESGKIVKEDPNCPCDRCLAVRALRHRS